MRLKRTRVQLPIPLLRPTYPPEAEKVARLIERLSFKGWSLFMITDYGAAQMQFGLPPDVPLVLFKIRLDNDRYLEFESSGEKAGFSITGLVAKFSHNKISAIVNNSRSRDR